MILWNLCIIGKPHCANCGYSCDASACCCEANPCWGKWDLVAVSSTDELWTEWKKYSPPFTFMWCPLALLERARAEKAPDLPPWYHSLPRPLVINGERGAAHLILGLDLETAREEIGLLKGATCSLGTEPKPPGWFHRACCLAAMQWQWLLITSDLSCIQAWTERWKILSLSSSCLLFMEGQLLLLSQGAGWVKGSCSRPLYVVLLGFPLSLPVPSPPALKTVQTVRKDPGAK